MVLLLNKQRMYYGFQLENHRARTYLKIFIIRVKSVRGQIKKELVHGVVRPIRILLYSKL